MLRMRTSTTAVTAAWKYVFGNHNSPLLLRVRVAGRCAITTTGASCTSTGTTIKYSTPTILQQHQQQQQQLLLRSESFLFRCDYSSKNERCFSTTNNGSNSNDNDDSSSNSSNSGGSSKEPNISSSDINSGKKVKRTLDEIVAKNTFKSQALSDLDDPSMLDGSDRRKQSKEQRFVVPEDPFGLLFNDGPDRLGPILPPIYERDSITGRLITETIPTTASASDEGGSNNDMFPTGSTTMMLKQQQQLSEQDKHVLSMDSMEREIKLLDSLKRHWQESENAGPTGSTGSSGTATTKELDAIGERIRTTEIATNVLGRSVHGQKTKELLEDGTEVISRETDSHFSQPLTLEEYNTFQLYMKMKHDMNVSVDDIPVSTQQKPNPLAVPVVEKRQKYDGRMKKEKEAPPTVHPDEAALSLKWLTSRAQRQMNDTLDDNPYSDLMPGDLSPNRVVNRRRAKRIPEKLLHCNNMSLLQHFISPTGQIMNRSQTRLGARDQRRVARLIKRSRSLGLIPHVGQFKIENHGWTHTNDIHTNRIWEDAIEQRGLVIQRSQQPHVASSKIFSFAKTVSAMAATKTTSLSTTSLPSSTTDLLSSTDIFPPLPT